MRILHLLASPYWSGPAELVALLAVSQRALGHEVTVAIDRRRTETAAEELALPKLEALGLADGGGLELSVKSRPWQVLQDCQRLARRQLDVVHAHFSHDHFVARWGRPKGARLVRSIHAPRSLRWSAPFAHAWTVPAMSMARALLGQKVMALPALVDPSFAPPVDRAALRRELGLAGTPLVGMISTFQPSRRHALGVASFARLRDRLPQAQLVLAGDGALLPDVRAQVASLGLEGHVTFAGYQSGESFVRHLQALDLVWILGLGNDFSARAAAQARACGVRVVAVDEGALPSYADALVELTADAIVDATLSDERWPAPLRSNDAIARDVIALYERA